jgi:type I restriction enzyme S subunit
MNKAPDIPEGWEDIEIRDLGEIVAGGTPSRANPSYWGGTIPWVTPSEITHLSSKYLTQTAERMTAEGLAGSAARLLPMDSVVVTTRATLGEAAIAAVPLATNQGFKSIIPREGTDPVFTYYLMSQIRQKMVRLASGTTFLEISKSDFEKIHLQRPKITEQRRIALVLKAMDEAIAKMEAVIAKLKQVRAGLLYDLLTRGLDEHGHVRDRINQPELFIDSPLGRIPKGWEVAPFRGYGSPDRPYIKTGPFGSSLKQEHWVERGIPVITIGSLGEGEFLRSELLYVSKGTAMELAAYAVIPGDIVFSRVADVGRSVVVGEEERGWLMSSNIMCISVDRTRADPHYVQATITSHPQVRRQIRRSLNSAGRDIANAPILNSIQVPWPRLDEQWRIVSMITSASKRIREEEKGLRKLLILKQGLTSDLLTGRVRVPEGIEVGS